MTDLSRQPAGTSSGGQFAPTGRGEAGVDVSQYAEPDGTMFFPARFETADDHLRWWKKVEVPDAILQDVVESYGESRKRQKFLYMGGHWVRPEKDPSWSDAEYEQRQRESVRAWNKRIEDFDRTVPKDIDRFLVRDAVRHHLAWRYAYTLPQSEQEKLAERKVDIADLSGTLSAFDTYFAMGGYSSNHPDAFTKLPDDGEKSSREIRAAMESMRREIAEARRLSELGLRTQHVSMGVDPARSNQIIAGEQVSGKPKSARRGSKEWAKLAKKNGA